MEGWKDIKEVKIGDIGERIVTDILINQGYVLYTPMDLEQAHPFDILAVRDKEEMIMVEVKTKRCREDYLDTGVYTRNFWGYKKLSETYTIPVFLYFVDYHLGEIYGNYLSVLEEKITVYPTGRELDYPRYEGGVTYFPLESMIHIDYLTDEEIHEISRYSA